MTTFSESLSTKVLTKLELLDLGVNKISDAGLKSFSKALGRETLPNLNTLVVNKWQIRQPELIAACKSRGIWLPEAGF